MRGSVATSVLPSPVFISAILPWWSTMPPTNWQSKCLMPSTLRDASRTVANASEECRQAFLVIQSLPLRGKQACIDMAISKLPRKPETGYQSALTRAEGFGRHGKPRRQRAPVIKQGRLQPVFPRTQRHRHQAQASQEARSGVNGGMCFPSPVVIALR